MSETLLSLGTVVKLKDQTELIIIGRCRIDRRGQSEERFKRAERKKSCCL